MEKEKSLLECVELIEYGCADWNEYVSAFQRLIDSGLVWQLQGSYGRHAVALIQAGECHQSDN